MKKVEEKDFPAIIEIYNTKGKRAANTHIRNTYGIKNPWSVIERIRRTPGYEYDPNKNRFESTSDQTDESIFMTMDELCGKAGKETAGNRTTLHENHSGLCMEKLIQELISDRLLEISKYVTLETASRTIMIDRTSMIAAGYKIETH